MKTFNKKLVVSLITTLILTGCMPDSLTKFKKDPPKKATTGNTSGPIVDDDGSVIDPGTFTDPSIFRYRLESSGTFVSEYIGRVGTRVELTPTLDGSIGTTSLVSKVYRSCSVSPALPSGLVLTNTATREGCTISGTPLAVSTNPLSPGDPITYTITLTYNDSTGHISTISTSLDIGIYIAPSSFSYTQSDKILLRVNVNSGTMNTVTLNNDVDAVYTTSGFLTSESGAIGVIKFLDKDTSRIGIVRTVPLTITNLSALGFPASEFLGTNATPRYVSAAGGKSARVIRMVSATNTLYVEMISGTEFAVGDSLKPTKSFTGAATTASISAIDTEYGIRRVANAINLDNNIQYFSNKFTAAFISSTYEVNKVLGVDHPRLQIITRSTSGSMTPANGIKYTVTPELPAGLSIDEETGEISGSFNESIETTQFVITVTNPIGNTSYTMGLTSIKAPKDLSYTTRQLVAVKNTTKFLEGEMLLQPVTPPMATNIAARIIRKYDRGSGTDENRYKLSIDTVNGKFGAGASLDSGNFFYSEKSFIPSTAIAPTSTTPSTTPIVVNYNVAVSVAAATNFTVGGYASTAQGALGKVVAIEGSTLFLQTLSLGTPPVYTPFQQRNGGAANGIDNAETYVAPETTITQVEASVLELTLASPTGSADFTVGKDLTSSGKLAGYIYESSQTAGPVDPTVIRISDISKKPGSLPYFIQGQTIYDNETEAGESATLSNVSAQNTFIVERGQLTEIQANLTEGNSIGFSISPALPMGLVLDTRTGVISGSPSVRTSMKTYTISATNLIGKSEYVFNLEVRDYFKIADGSGASSFIVHRYGANRNERSCKINATDIIEGSGDLDVRCFLEGEEEELHNTKLKILSSAGAGVCEFIQIEPYSFYSHAPIRTTTATVVRVAPSCATPSGPAVPGPYSTTAPLSNTICGGDYTDNGGPNCDSGSYTLITYSGSDSDSSGTCDDPGELTSVTQTISCNGKKVACLQGPVTDILSESELSQGYRSIISPTSSGTTLTSTFSSPYQKLDSTNLRVANATVANKCLMTNDDADTWEAAAAATAATASPFGESSPYYTFNCLTAAKDIKARIRVAVRDWNRTFKIDSLIDEDLPGAAITTPPYSSPVMNNVALSFGKSNNDYADWDDDFSGLGAADFGSCATGGTQYEFPENNL